jgi:hypothetical protein
MLLRLAFLSLCVCAVQLGCGVPPSVEPDSGAGPQPNASEPAPFDGGRLGDAGFEPVDAGTHGPMDAGPADAGPNAQVDAGPGDAGPLAARPVTLCLTGACPLFTVNCSSNDQFTEVCEHLAGLDAGVVASSSGHTFATYPVENAATVMAPLFAALDRNHDGAVNATDGPVDLNLLGFSWGGKNLGDLTERLTADARIDQATLHVRVVMLDPYQPFKGPVVMAAAVDEAWNFRHATAPSDDCSRRAPLGPYLGLPLQCPVGMPCHDYDFSLTGQSFQGIPGDRVGHCDVALAARDFIFELLLQGHITSPLPPLAR